MLKKSFKIFITFVSAIVIAFSCFTVSSSASDTSVLDFVSIGDIGLLVHYDIFDDSGSLVETVYVQPDILLANFESNKVFIDVSSASGSLIKKGYSVEAYFNFNFKPVFKGDSYSMFFYSSGLSPLVDSLNCSLVGDSVLEDYVDFLCYDNCLYIPTKFTYGSYYSCYLPFVCTSSSDSLSFVVEFTKDVSDIEYYISHSQSAPRKYKFFSDMGSFFRTSVDWVTNIFDNFVENPAILVLVIGFVLVGFVFGILRKFIFES